MIARALLASLSLASLTAFAACTQTTNPPPASTPPISSDTAGPAAAPPADTTAVPAPAPSGKPCIQRVMCVKGTHFDHAGCHCACDEGNTACLDAGAPGAH